MLQEYRYNNAQELAKALADDLAVRLNACVQEKGNAVLALSGGKTPTLFLQALSRAELPWQKLIITLVDERWCGEDDERSNARLLKQHLLHGEAAKAWFVPLYNGAATAFEGYQDCENRLFEELPRLDFAVLGMGLDGHCASWFKGSKALAQLVGEQTQARSVPVDDAPDFPERMSLTWAFLRQCQRLYLHIEGAEKKAVLDKARAEELPLHSLPVRKVLSQNSLPLSLYYCL